MRRRDRSGRAQIPPQRRARRLGHSGIYAAGRRFVGGDSIRGRADVSRMGWRRLSSRLRCPEETSRSIATNSNDLEHVIANVAWAGVFVDIESSCVHHNFANSKTNAIAFWHMGKPRLPRASNGRQFCREPSGSLAASAGGGIRQYRIGSPAGSRLAIHRIRDDGATDSRRPSLCGVDSIGGGIPRDGSRHSERPRNNAEFPHLRGNGKTDQS